jgi:hypothetical protein
MSDVINSVKTLILGARPSFTEGVSRTLDIFGTLQQYNTSLNTKKADFEAMKNDWSMVGQDITAATHIYEQEKRSTL